MSDWRYLAQDALTGAWLHREVPLTNVEVTDTLSGPPLLTGTIAPEFLGVRDETGRPVLQEWSTKIFPERNGLIRGGGMLVRTVKEDDGDKWSLEIPGLSYYPRGIPFDDVYREWEPDAFDAVRRIWSHVQAQPDGNIGVVVDDTKAGVTVGDTQPPAKPVRKKGETKTAFGTRMSKWKESYGDRLPYELLWWESKDCGEEIDRLSTETPFDWREVSSWAPDGSDAVQTRIVLAGRLGRRRTDLRFVLGENCAVIPTVDRDGDEYANQILVLGAGEGRDMKRAVTGRRDGRVRRVAVVAAKDEKNDSRLRALAADEHGKRALLDEIEEIVTWDHPNAPLGSVQLGDDIPVQIQVGWIDVDAWFRVVGVRYRPEDEDTITLRLVRAERG